MYIKEGRLPDIDRMYGDETSPPTSITSRIHTGTAHFATYLSVPAALDFHAAVGSAYKAARVRYLRDRWVSQVRATPEIDVLTLVDPGAVAAITSFRIRKRTSRAENQAVVTELLERYRLFTAWRTGLAGGDCVRVTPALYNTTADADRMAAALKEIAGRG
jgi:selenocysteine lyase/cysteine desulfurase